MPMTSGIIVSAIVEHDGQLLMVREQHPGEAAQWVLPGGLAEPGELVHQALVREVREETGLTVAGPAALAFITQYTVTGEPGWDGEWTVFAFATAQPEGRIDVADPDGLVLEAAWVPFEEAVARLAAHRFSPRRDPTVAYLHDRTTAGALWLWPDGPAAAPIVISTPFRQSSMGDLAHR
ncbi:NUDIX domain-containing protein [Actinomadura sp. NEAU-AAG5]|uniref:NUDIX domain-containing protein n=2 Tax=Actinomadura litoris TaxID=2678616 RepID=A0A7K1L8B8_9ACTN|nr:NUDIX domain-containing protein [Actinomadura litoris]